MLRLDRPPADVVEQLRQLAAALDAWPTDAATDLDGFRRAFAQHLDERTAPDVCLLTRRSTS